MTEAQIAAFQAASQSKPEAINLLMLGLFVSAMLLWCAWSLLLLLVSFWLALS